MSEKKSPKTFVLDVSVLIHDPKAPLYFEENTVLIPTLTVKNLKEASQKPGERGANARDALRNLMELFHNCPAMGTRYTFPENEDEMDMAIATEECVPDLDMFNLDGSAFAVPTVILQETGGEVSIVPTQATDILAVAREQNAILVTKDIATRLCSFASGVEAQDYRHDHPDEVSKFYSGRSIVYLPGKLVSELAKGGAGIPFPEGTEIYGVDDSGLTEFQRPSSYKLSENEFLTVKNVDAPASGGALGRYTKGTIQPLRYANCKPFDVTPRNVAQRFAIEALMTPAEGPQDRAPLVILKGPAGTAKTFLSIACGLEQAYENHDYRSILVTRQSSLLDEPVGYLPGGEYDKVSPLLRSVFDNVEALMPNFKKEYKDGVASGPVEDLVAQGALQIQAMTFMRGRSIENTYVVVDEAQNCTAAQLLTLITRASKGTRICLLGDVDQIDSPYLDRYSSGLTVVSEMMKGSPVCWQVSFTDAECERSELANEAIHRLSRKN